MRIRKTRHGKKLWRKIESWKENNLELDIEGLNSYSRDYLKVGVYPSFNITNSKVKEPKGKTKELIIDGLVEVYKSWKKELDKTGKPYYLKIWLYDPFLSSSQLVCAINEDCDFYNNTFEKSNLNNKINFNKYKKSNQQELSKFDWEECFNKVYLCGDEDWIDFSKYEKTEF